MSTMTPAQRRARVEAGMCAAYLACPRKAKPGNTRCRQCIANKAASAARAYEKRKLRGLCMQTGCKNKADGHLCDAHKQRQANLHAKWMAYPANRERAQASHRRYYEGKKSRCKCRYSGCNLPLHTLTMCLKHALQARKRSETIRRKRGKKPSANLCTNCRGLNGPPGHRADTCTGFYEAPVSIDEYAASRPGAGL